MSAIDCSVGSSIYEELAAECPTAGHPVRLRRDRRGCFRTGRRIPAELLRRAHERDGVRGAEADRVHPHSPIGRLLGRHQRVDAPRVRPVGQQDDDVGMYESARPGLRADARSVAEVERCSVRCRGSPRPGRRATSGWRCRSRCRSTSSRPSIALDERSSSSVGGTTIWAISDEGDDRRSAFLRLVLDEVPRGVLRDRNRFGSTSVAHIERETSSARMIDVLPRGTDTVACGRASGEHERGQARQQQRERAGGDAKRDRRGSASRISERLAYRTAYLRLRRCSST